jgi:transposase InsO family protein
MYNMIKQHQQQLPVSRLCRLLKVSRSAYYSWLNASPSQRMLNNVLLDQHIKQLFLESNDSAGYRMIRALLISSGIQSSLGRVRRRMRHLGIKARQFKCRRQSSKVVRSLGYSDNLLQRNFNVNKPNQVWVGDITYVRVSHGWMYLATVIDLYARKVVGWSFGSRMQTHLVREAFDRAMLHRGCPQGVLFHSDRGSQYASSEFRLQLALSKTRQSMSGKGSCYDNAVAESFFKTLKAQCAYRMFVSTETAKTTIFKYIEAYYNNKRPHSFNNYLSPNTKEDLYFQNLATKAA